ncbi:MAG: hypothetical protein R2831_12780 [Chitinophagaceae bacterium]
MTKNGLDIQTISTMRTDFQADRVLLLGQVTEKKEKAHPSHFLKFLLASRTNGTLVFAPTAQANPSAKAKEPLFSNAFFGSSKLITIFVNLFR